MVDNLEAFKPYDRMLTIVQGQKWKDIRSTLSPTFSASKMKQASKLNFLINYLLPWGNLLIGYFNYYCNFPDK